MPALLARIGIYVIAAAITLDAGLHYFGKFEYHFPFYGTFSVFLVPLGSLLILAAVVAKLNARASAAGPEQHIIGARSAETARFEVFNTADPISRRPVRWPLRPRFASLPSRGLISFSLAVPLIIAMWIHAVNFTPIGFRVYLLPAAQTAKVEPATGTLTLRIDAKGRYYLDSRLIAREELANSVSRLAWPGPPVVYLYADPNLDYRDVIAAIDTLRSLRANVVLLTPRSRAGLR